MSSPHKKAEVACLKHGAPNSEIEVDLNSMALEPSAVITSSSCESEPPLADNPDEDEEPEDQTIFFTPELFEDEGDEGSPQEEKKTKSPPRMESPTLLSEELFGLEQAQRQGQASAFDGQSAISVSEENTELSHIQKEEIRGHKQVETEQLDNQSRQTDSRLRRLSRSRHKALSSPTGN